jgi:histidinol-phosphate/aromatic aminotransferase/cobyric acid decarboxylase-like protein
VDGKKLKKFSSRVDPEVLEALREIANAENCKLYVLIDEAFCDYLAKKGFNQMRQKITKHFDRSLHEFETLYQELA